MKSAHCLTLLTDYFTNCSTWSLLTAFLWYTTLLCSSDNSTWSLFFCCTLLYSAHWLPQWLPSSTLLSWSLLYLLLCCATLLCLLMRHLLSALFCFTCVSQLCFGLFSVHKAVICSILLMHNAPLTHAAFCHLRAFSYFLSLVFILNPKGEGRQKNKKLCCKFCIILKCSVNQWWEKWNDFTFTLISCILGAVVNTPDCVWVNAVDPELVVRLQQLSG